MAVKPESSYRRFLERPSEDSVVVVGAWALANLLALFSLPHLLASRIWPNQSKGAAARPYHMPMWFIDCWILFLVGLLGVTLALFMEIPIWLHIAVPLLVMHDLVLAILREILVAPGTVIRSARRWILLQLLHIVEVVLAFAVLFRVVGDTFEPKIDDAVSALYQSALTFTTLGYGDIKPEPDALWTKGLVTFELLFFVLFIAIKVPAAVSLLKITTVDGGSRGEPRSDRRDETEGES